MSWFLLLWGRRRKDVVDSPCHPVKVKYSCSMFLSVTMCSVLCIGVQYFQVLLLFVRLLYWCHVSKKGVQSMSHLEERCTYDTSLCVRMATVLYCHQLYITSRRKTKCMYSTLLNGSIFFHVLDFPCWDAGASQHYPMEASRASQWLLPKPGCDLVGGVVTCLRCSLLCMGKLVLCSNTWKVVNINLIAVY